MSLEGATAATHDGIRNIPGLFDQTLLALDARVAAGLTLQINTTVMARNVDEMADIAKILASKGVHVWEVFFLVHLGRGEATGAIAAQLHEEVCHFLYDSSHYGFIVRAVAAPFFRRVVAQRRADTALIPDGEPYGTLSARLVDLLGAPARERDSAHTAATRDGKGIVFVAHNGEVYPTGFLALELGNLRDRPLAEIYRDSPILKDIRAAKFSGRCGVCEYADLCGGSRARAYATTGGALTEDTACIYQPTIAVTSSNWSPIACVTPDMAAHACDRLG